MERIKTETLWGITTGDILLPFTIRATRREAIDDFIKDREWYPSWHKAKEQGYDVKKLSVSWKKEHK